MPFFAVKDRSEHDAGDIVAVSYEEGIVVLRKEGFQNVTLELDTMKKIIKQIEENEREST